MDSIKLKIGSVEREFRLLSAEALADLSARAPSFNGDIIDINGLDKWAKHPTGCIEFLFKSASRNDPKLTREDVGKWGGVLGRTQAASALFVASILNGEEDTSPKAQASETGG